VNGLRSSLKMMERMDGKNAEKKLPPPTSYNEHE